LPATEPSSDASIGKSVSLPARKRSTMYAPVTSRRWIAARSFQFFRLASRAESCGVTSHSARIAGCYWFDYAAQYIRGIMSRRVAILVFDGFADWEPAYALTGLRRWGGRSVTSVGFG